MRPRLTDPPLPRTLRARGPEPWGTGSSQRYYRRVGLSVVRHGMLLLALAVLALIILAAGASPVKP